MFIFNSYVKLPEGSLTVGIALHFSGLDNLNVQQIHPGSERRSIAREELLKVRLRPNDPGMKKRNGIPRNSLG